MDNSLIDKKTQASGGFSFVSDPKEIKSAGGDAAGVGVAGKNYVNSMRAVNYIKSEENQGKFTGALRKIGGFLRVPVKVLMAPVAFLGLLTVSFAFSPFIFLREALINLPKSLIFLAKPFSVLTLPYCVARFAFNDIYLHEEEEKELTLRQCIGYHLRGAAIY